jgi:lysophospholipase L1-like esterase
MHPLIRLILTPVLRARLAAQRRDNGGIPRPRDSQFVFASGPNPDKILIFGSGIAVGYGVVTHDLGLPGALARALTRRTGRGTDVEVVANSRIQASTARLSLATIELDEFDALVITLGVNDTLRVTPLPTWTRKLTELLDHIDARRSDNLCVIIAGIHPIQMLPVFGGTIGSWLDQHAMDLNTRTEDIIAERQRTVFVPLGSAPPRRGSRGRDGGSYANWAEALATTMAPLLDRQSGNSGSDAPD